MATSIKRLGAAALAGAAAWLLCVPAAFGQFVVSPAYSFRAGAPLNQNYYNLAAYGRALQTFPPYAFPFNAPSFMGGPSPAVPPFYGAGYRPPPVAYPSAPYGGATLTTAIPYSPGYVPYSPGYVSPYEAGYSPGMAGYGGGAQGPGSPGYGGENGARAEMSPETKRLSQTLAASGVPNDGGRLQWPVGLRAVGGPAADELRQQIEALLKQEVGQAQSGPVNPQVAKDLARAVDALRKILLRDRDERFSLTPASYEDAERFLAKLGRAQQLLAEGREPSGGKSD
jgi:hypothetical protein